MKKKIDSLLTVRNLIILFSINMCGFTPLGIYLLAATKYIEPVVSTPTANPNFVFASPTAPISITQPPTLSAAESTNTAGTQIAAVTQTAVSIDLTNQPAPSPTPYPLLYNEDGDSIPITWGDYPGPTTWPSVDIPPPLGIIPVPSDQINIILLGNDYRKKLGTRTDTIMLLTLNPSSGTASITSFPRDLYVYAPGWTMYKFNTVQPRGGYDLLKLTFEYNFGIRPNFYVNINRDTFVNVVNSLGGIYVQVEYPLSDPTYAKGKFSVPSGTVFMDGATARWFASSRNTSNVYKRDKRQQAVLKGIFLKLLSLNGLQRVPELFNTYKNEVRTDLGVENLLALVPLASQLTDTTRISQHAIDDRHVTPFRTPVTDAYVLIPDQLSVLIVMMEALSP